jgi:hypothetical protein
VSSVQLVLAQIVNPVSLGLRLEKGVEVAHDGKYASQSKATTCQVCSAGSFSISNSTYCTLCTTGLYSELSGSSFCDKCFRYSFNIHHHVFYANLEVKETLQVQRAMIAHLVNRLSKETIVRIA